MDETLSTTTELILDDGRIEPMKEYLSPEELYQDLIECVKNTIPAMIFP